MVIDHSIGIGEANLADDEPRAVQATKEELLKEYEDWGSDAAVIMNSIETANKWSIEVLCKQFEVGGSFAVHLFVGSVPEYEEWNEKAIQIFHVFANSNPEECATCRDNIDGYVRGGLDITRQLVKLEKDLRDVDGTIAYLRENLRWGVESVSGFFTGIW